MLLKINAVFGVDVQLFSENDEGRLIADLRDALNDVTLPETVSVAELRERTANMPAVARALVSLHRRYRAASERSKAMAAQLGDDWQRQGLPPMPFEEVRDFFYARHNHIAELNGLAERLHAGLSFVAGAADAILAEHLATRHGVTIVVDDGGGEPTG